MLKLDSSGKDATPQGIVSKPCVNDYRTIGERIGEVRPNMKRVFQDDGGGTPSDLYSVRKGEILFSHHKRTRRTRGVTSMGKVPRTPVMASLTNFAVEVGKESDEDILDVIYFQGIASTEEDYVTNLSHMNGDTLSTGCVGQVGGMQTITNTGTDVIRDGDLVIYGLPPRGKVDKKVYKAKVKEKIYPNKKGLVPIPFTMQKHSVVKKFLEGKHPGIPLELKEKFVEDIISILRRSIGIAKQNADVGERFDILIGKQM